MALNKLERILEEFRKLDPEMPMQTAMTLLFVAQNQDAQDGVSIKMVAEALGISSAAASRNVSRLSKVGVKQQIGHGLVETFEDPLFRVRKCVKLTPKGRRVIQSIVEVLNDN
jgi:DNA-binding MarR family transcriptional regulator